MKKLTMERSIEAARVRLEACKTDDWDGDGAIAVSTENEEFAFTLARDMDMMYRTRFGKDMPVPSFFPDGMSPCVNIEFDTRRGGKGIVLMITVDTTQISYYGERNGMEKMNDIIIDELHARESTIEEIVTFMGGATAEEKLAEGIPLVPLNKND